MLDAVYRERPSVVDHAVVWSATADSAREDHRVLPDGCMDLLWVGDELLVAGPDTGAYLASWTPSKTYVGLRFGAGVGPHVVGVPAHELRDQRVRLAEIWPSARVRRLCERLAMSDDAGAVLELMATARLEESGLPDSVTTATFQLLDSGRSVDEVADTVGLSVRQLHRRSVASFGYGPKTLARVLRVNRALDLGRQGSSPAEAAAVAGYADQAHLAREVRSLTGSTFTTLMS